MSEETRIICAAIDWDKVNGLVPVVVQDLQRRDVLMLAYMSREALVETVETRRACYYSRTSKSLWRKGEQSGNVQIVKEIWIDCPDETTQLCDTVLLQVEQIGGAACHTGNRSCFYRQLTEGGLKVIGERVFDPKDVYR